MTAPILIPVLVAVGLAAAWEPQPPWVTPSQECINRYTSWLGSYSSEYKAGHRDQLPEHPGERGIVNNMADCVKLCFMSTITPKDLGILHIYGIYQPDGGHCYCTGTREVNGTSDPSVPSIYTVLKIPTGCLYENQQACINAPADGCIWDINTNCCMDAAGYSWPTLHDLVPWWAWGVGAVLLLLSSLLGLVVRARTRYNSDDYNIIGDDTTTIDASKIKKMKEEYAKLLEELVEADVNEQALEKGGKIQEPDQEADHVDGDHVSTAGSDKGSRHSDGAMCPVCLESLSGAKCVRLKCGHRLRYECMKEYVMHSVDQGHIPQCPICRAHVLVTTTSSSSDSDSEAV